MMQELIGAKTLALLAERDSGPRDPAVSRPRLDQRYQAGQLPAGSVVCFGSAEYVVGRTGLCMKWEQPIPGSAAWTVTYAGRLPEGIWMTPRERAEVDEAQ